MKVLVRKGTLRLAVSAVKNQLVFKNYELQTRSHILVELMSCHNTNR